MSPFVLSEPRHRRGKDLPLYRERWSEGIFSPRLLHLIENEVNMSKGEISRVFRCFGIDRKDISINSLK